MKRKKKCVAMLLAGGQGSRLGILTQKIAKPAVGFGGKYRIIDFPLSNCSNSGIDTVGVLTQYKPFLLNSYIGIGSAWDLDKQNGGVYLLPPFVREDGGRWYKGTADAIYQNIDFIDQFDCEYVLILSGDHIYKMDYSWMLHAHEMKKADATIAVIEVPWEEASRFGIMNTDSEDRILEFEEKPKEPKSNLASMGIYIFTWKLLREKLLEDGDNPDSSHDFGKDIIPNLLSTGKRIFAYPFSGYWKDVGTVESFWEANMDLLGAESSLDLDDRDWRINSVSPTYPPHYIGSEAVITNSIIGEGCMILGQVENSVIFGRVSIGENVKVKDSIIFSGVNIARGSEVYKAILSSGVSIGQNCTIAAPESEGKRKIIVLGEDVHVADGYQVMENIG
ncbi:MAG: glucose-1-phosphate adenylyltransferase [bacterium]